MCTCLSRTFFTFISHACVGCVLDPNRFSMLLNLLSSSGAFMCLTLLCGMWKPCLYLHVCAFRVCFAELGFFTKNLDLGEMDTGCFSTLWVCFGSEQSLSSGVIKQSDKAGSCCGPVFLYITLQHSVNKQAALLSFSTWPT